MTIRELTIKEIRQTYKEHLRRDFPAEERKPLAMIERSYRRGDYLCLGAFEDGRMTGYAFFVFCGRNCLLDYYAVLPDLRGRGIGSEFLKRMTDTALTDRADILLIEVENPRYAAMEADLSLRKRRLDFYLNCGIIDTGVEANVFGVEYRLLEYPLSAAHTPSEAAEAYDGLYRHLLPPLLYRRNIKVRDE